MKLASLAPLLPSLSFFLLSASSFAKHEMGGDFSFPKKKLLLCLSENMPPKQGSISISRFPFPFRFFPAISRKKNCILRLFFFSCASRIYELPINRPRKKRGSLLTRPCLFMLCFPQLFFFEKLENHVCKNYFPLLPCAKSNVHIFCSNCFRPNQSSKSVSSHENRGNARFDRYFGLVLFPSFHGRLPSFSSVPKPLMPTKRKGVDREKKEIIQVRNICQNGRCLDFHES